MNQPQRPRIFSSRHLRWLLALPKVGILLLLVSLSALLWFVHSNEQEEEHTTLIKDVLWLEQNLRFHLSSNEELMQQLAVEMSTLPEKKQTFRLRITHHLKNNPEVSQVFWLDAHKNIVDVLPGGTLPDQEVETFGTAPSIQIFELARKLDKIVYSEPFFLENHRAFIETAIPIYEQGHFNGVLIALTPFDSLLNNFVPWWFAEKYQVQIVDENDLQYATKTKIERPLRESYDIAFDPPGYGLKLRIQSYANPPPLLQRMLTFAVIIIAIGVFWSLMIVRDLMKKRTEAEEALGAEHAFRKAMEDSLTVGMRARDLYGKVIYVNPAFCKMTGFSSTELVGSTPPMPYWVPDQLDEAYAMHQAVLAGKAPADGFEMTFMRKNGEKFNALVYEARLIDAHGRHTGWMASVLDVTERRRAEELARQQQEQLQFTARLVTMGEMASTLAHELNQPLAAIASYNTGSLNLLSRSDCHPQDIRPALEKIGVQAQRAGKIIRRVHDFVRKSEPKRAPCQLAEIIEDCLGFVEADARKRQVRIDCTLPPLPDIPADRLMLEQVLLNLIRNAMEAMSNTPDEAKTLQILVNVDSETLTVKVADHGSGIAPENKEKLFTAFFTTKAEGMGVGLSICRSIIEFHRGRIWVEENTHSPTGSGTIFLFTLPIANV